MANLLHHAGWSEAELGRVGRPGRDPHVLDPREGGAQAVHRARLARCSASARSPSSSSASAAASPSRRATRCCAASRRSTSCSAPRTSCTCPSWRTPRAPGARPARRLRGRPRRRASSCPSCTRHLPRRRPGRAFVTVMEGCDLFCAYCVVPRTRGREVSRPSARDPRRGRERWPRRGISEVTLLGQTVNAYGRPRPGRVRGRARASPSCCGASPQVPGHPRGSASRARTRSSSTTT